MSLKNEKKFKVKCNREGLKRNQKSIFFYKMNLILLFN
jgi:hypothetical protein